MSGRAFLDTNILVYSVDSADPAKHQKARDILAAQTDFAISAQVLNEFYVVVTRKLKPPLSASHAEVLVHRLAQLHCVPIDADLVLAGVAASQKWQLSLWDGLVVEAARQAGCVTLLSEDLSDGANYQGIRIENPFRN